MNPEKISRSNGNEKNKIEILKQNLKEIFGYPKYSTLGHGTNKDQAEKILQNGLESATDELSETVIPLDEKEETFKTILNWPHRNYKSIVIVMIPNPNQNQGGLSYFNNVFDELPENKKVDSIAGREFDKQFFISPKFIKGYINVENLSFVNNPLYDENAEVVIKEKPGLSPKIQKDIAIPKPQEKKDSDPDVW